MMCGGHRPRPILSRAIDGRIGANVGRGPPTSRDSGGRRADGGRRTVDGGRWTVNGGRWTVDGGVDGGLWAAGGGRRTADGGRWTVDGGRRAADGGRWTAGGGRWTVDGGRRAADGGRRMTGGGGRKGIPVAGRCSAARARPRKNGLSGTRAHYGMPEHVNMRKVYLGT